ncbi:MAG: hypothetical protein PCFJNLEI_02984 [Verrucomicrobiae bacterium]|nr:hypothetical protein [Verrucomicrobiae bacterium]
MRRFWIVIVCLLALGIACARPKPAVKKPTPPPPAPKPQPPTLTETRAVWVSDTAKLDWDSAVRNLQRTGFNTMYVNLASAGAAWYPGSQVLPSIVEGKPDPIARGIELARRAGIAVHAKQIVMFSFKSPPEFQRQLINADRVMRGADGKPIMQSGVYWLCPSNPTNRDQSLAVVGEMLGRYPVAGLHLDYIRFNESPSCLCQRCRQAYEQFTGKPVARWSADVPRFNEWRQSVITDWAQRLSAKARQTRPGIKMSAAVFPGLERAKEEKAQDWKLWVERGYLDTICPMNYTTDPGDFELRCRETLRSVPRNRVVMGIGSWKFDPPAGMVGQIEQTRRLGMGGFALFSYDDLATRQAFPNLTGK